MFIFSCDTNRYKRQLSLNSLYVGPVSILSTTSPPGTPLRLTELFLYATDLVSSTISLRVGLRH